MYNCDIFKKIGIFWIEERELFCVILIKIIKEVFGIIFGGCKKKIDICFLEIF